MENVLPKNLKRTTLLSVSSTNSQMITLSAIWPEKEVLHRFVETVIADYGKVDYLINNALPLMKGIKECSYEEFNYALKVGITAPFYLTKLFLPYFAPDAAIVNISSSRDRMSQPQTESYTAAKGGIAALTHSLAVSLAGKFV